MLSCLVINYSIKNAQKFLPICTESAYRDIAKQQCGSNLDLGIIHTFLKSIGKITCLSFMLSCLSFLISTPSYAVKVKPCEHKYYHVDLKGDLLKIPIILNPVFYLDHKSIRVSGGCGPKLDKVDKIILHPYKYSKKYEGGSLSTYGWDNLKVGKEIARSYQDNLRIQITSDKNNPDLEKEKKALSAPKRPGLYGCSQKVNYIRKSSELNFIPDEKGAYYDIDNKLFDTVLKPKRIVLYYGCKPYFNVSNTNLGVGASMSGYIFDYIQIHASGRSAYMPPMNWPILFRELRKIKVIKGIINEFQLQ